MKRLLLIILIASLLPGCASFKAWWKEYCHPTQIIEPKEIESIKSLGDGSYMIDYTNGDCEIKDLSEYELSEYELEYPVEREEESIRNMKGEIIYGSGSIH